MVGQLEMVTGRGLSDRVLKPLNCQAALTTDPRDRASDRCSVCLLSTPPPMLEGRGAIWRQRKTRMRAPSSLQKIRLSSDWANLLNRSRNGRADGDGCVEFAADAEVAHGSRGKVGQLEMVTGRGLSDRVLKPLHCQTAPGDGSR